MIAKVALPLVVVAFVAETVAAQIRPLDEATLRTAAAGGGTVNDVFIASATSNKDALQQYKTAPYSILIETPYHRAATLTEEARRRYQPLPVLSVDDLNAQQIVVRVEAGRLLTTAGTVEGLVLKRGDVLIRPTREQVTPATISNALGNKRSSAVGFFEFPLDTFSPVSGPLTVVVIGKTGNFEWTLSVDALYQLK